MSSHTHFFGGGGRGGDGEGGGGVGWGGGGDGGGGGVLVGAPGHVPSLPCPEPYYSHRLL